jgi:protein-tyrosine phosphatase
MVEFPHNHFPSMAYPFLRRLTAMGIHPCIVHPERNLDIQKQPNLVLQLRQEYDVLIQVTAGSLSGEWGGAARLCAIFLVRNRLCDFIASDAHSPESRPPLLSKAVKIAAKFSNHEISRAMIHDQPQALLHKTGAA